MNLVNDDDEMIQHMKGKTAMKWDSKKKRYVLKKIDAERKVIKEKRNESGARVTNKSAAKLGEQKVYKKWMQKTHLKLQAAGEQEDTKMVERARTSNDSRKMMKAFSKGHKDFNKGEDARSNQHVVKMKKKKMLEKMKKNGREARGGERGEQSGGKRGGKYGDKQWNKIVEKSRPTRSKVIMKGGSGGRGGGRGGKGFRGRGRR